MEVLGFKDGFLGLMQDRYARLHTDDLSGILTRGGTVLGTSRVKVNRVSTNEGRKIDGRPEMRKVVEDFTWRMTTRHIGAAIQRLA